MPGFNDAHVHFVSGGDALACVQLRDAASAEEFRRRIGDYAKSLPKGAWVRNGLLGPHELDIRRRCRPTS